MQLHSKNVIFTMLGFAALSVAALLRSSPSTPRAAVPTPLESSITNDMSLSLISHTTSVRKTSFSAQEDVSNGIDRLGSKRVSQAVGNTPIETADSDSIAILNFPSRSDKAFRSPKLKLTAFSCPRRHPNSGFCGGATGFDGSNGLDRSPCAKYARSRSWDCRSAWSSLITRAPINDAATRPSTKIAIFTNTSPKRGGSVARSLLEVFDVFRSGGLVLG
jgi:hypothetical protein